MKRGSLAPLLLSLVLVSPMPAQAAEPSAPPTAQPTPTQIQAARELFNAARKDEDALRWADALEKLERVAAVKQTASVRYHIALCEEKLGRTASALSQYVEALDAAEEEHNKDVADLLKNAFLAELRARVPQLTLELPPDVPEAEVKLDEHVVPPNQWRVAVPVDPGAHHIEVRAPGRAPFSKDFVLREREVTVLDVPLQPTAAAAAASRAAPNAEVFPTTPPRSEGATPPRRSIAFPLAAGIGALVLAGGGVGAYVAAGSAQSEGLQECPTRSNCDSLKATVHTWDDLALGAWIGAGVLGAAAVVLWALPSKSAQVRLTAAPMRVQLEGSF